jgi:endo-1,4-beta-xylanase
VVIGRAFCAVGIAVVALVAPAVARADGLRDLRPQPLIGTSVNEPALANESDYDDVLAREFDFVTPENSMKWKYVEPQQGVTDYSQPDRVVDFAAAHGQLVRGHTLVWYNALPSWLTQGNFSADQLASILQQHVTDEVTHFAGRIYAWDVVNEPFNSDGSWRHSLWYDAMGPDYVAEALAWAHAADPAAKLYINEYNAEAIGPRSDALYALVSQLKAEGVPIDGVGFQAHLDIANPFPSDLESNLARFAALGVDVAITEADVRIPVPATEESLAIQAEYFGRLARACVDVSRCASLAVWGFTDRHSWVPFSYAHEGAATPFDENLQPKPAYYALRDAFTLPPVPPASLPSHPTPAPAAPAPRRTAAPARRPQPWAHLSERRLRRHGHSRGRRVRHTRPKSTRTARLGGYRRAS